MNDSFGARLVLRAKELGVSSAVKKPKALRIPRRLLPLESSTPAWAWAGGALALAAAIGGAVYAVTTKKEKDPWPSNPSI